jgi:hypothetical protein
MGGLDVVVIIVLLLWWGFNQLVDMEDDYQTNGRRKW